ncbi:MAG: Hsp33 family molecular chaperone HslO, partial [Candidatus Eisenbacteria bacterium]|nr:Hsp33 family molecular chaperone HslO [Candidatus Eisenbacteria bacterium]
VSLRRTIDEERHLIVSHGDFRDFFAAWESHVKIWDGLPDGLGSVMMRQALAVGVLHLSNAPRDLSFGLTIHLHTPPTNVFVTGHAADSAVTGRIYVDGVKQMESSRVYMQSQRPEHEPSLSVLEVHGFDILEFLESYYLNSEQRHARFFELAEEGGYLQVLSLPGADPALFSKLDRDSAAALLRQDLTVLEERTFFFQCGCTPQKMMTALHDIFGERPDELFQGDERVETSCPRCGRRWWVTREEFSDGTP